jgi:hypothetical protein
MRGTFVDQGGLFSYIAPEARVPVTHPLRKTREIVRDVLGELTRSLGRLYASEGRPSIPPVLGPVRPPQGSGTAFRAKIMILA